MAAVSADVKTLTSCRCDACAILTAVHGFDRREKELAFAPSKCSIPTVAFPRGNNLRASPLLLTRFPGRSDRHARSAKDRSKENEMCEGNKKIVTTDAVRHADDNQNLLTGLSRPHYL